MQIKLTVLGLGAITLTACMDIGNPAYDQDYSTYNYGKPMMLQSSYGSMQLPNESSDVLYSSETPEPTNSYYVGPAKTPVSFKDKDRQWVRSQNPQGYTIEVADDEKAAKVAGKLYQLPKNDRMAQIKYQRDGKGYYKGIYGSYDSQEAAQKAIEALPEGMRKEASVKNWQSVQGNIME